MTNRAYGRFKVYRRLLEDAPNGANLFHRMVVLQATPNFATEEIEYYAAHPDFRVLMLGETIPEYVAFFSAESIYPRWKELG